MYCDCVTERGFPGLHLAIIYDNGSVWDFSFEEKIPRIKEKLLKLPKSGGYYGFSDDQGILYFLHFLDTKPIIKFHKKEGRKTIPKSIRNTCSFQDYYSECVKTEYNYGILLRIGFWTFYKGKAFYNHGHKSYNYGNCEL